MIRKHEAKMRYQHTDTEDAANECPERMQATVAGDNVLCLGNSELFWDLSN